MHFELTVDFQPFATFQARLSGAFVFLEAYAAHP
jgi:hypothetical protein